MQRYVWGGEAMFPVKNEAGTHPNYTYYTIAAVDAEMARLKAEIQSITEQMKYLGGTVEVLAAENDELKSDKARIDDIEANGFGPSWSPVRACWVRISLRDVITEYRDLRTALDAAIGER